MDYINAFWVGGLICALTQILLDRTKLMPGRIMVLLVCSGSVLGAFKIYPVIQDFAGAGASVPWKERRAHDYNGWNQYCDIFSRIFKKR